MNDGLPDQMPERPPPPHVKLAGPRPPRTKVPRVFSIWGTICYGIAAVFCITAVLLMGFTKWIPPWYFISSAFLYCFISTGLITMGRIESNKDAKFFIRALRQKSAENQRTMRKMN
jgi:hypothetical protein